MPSYVNAPATKLLATHCACCGRPLVDAKSVETGVGPDCRERHGYGEAQGTPDWNKAATLLGADNKTVEALWIKLPATIADFWGEGPELAHAAANWLTYTIAARQTGVDVIAATAALAALGYTKLAARIIDRIADVRITFDGTRYHVESPYSDEAVAEFKKIPGRLCIKDGKRWDISYPVASKRALWDTIRKLYLGRVLVGPQGLVNIV